MNAYNRTSKLLAFLLFVSVKIKAQDTSMAPLPDSSACFSANREIIFILRVYHT